MSDIFKKFLLLEFLCLWSSTIEFLFIFKKYLKNWGFNVVGVILSLEFYCQHPKIRPPFFNYCYNSKTICMILLKLIPYICYEILHFTQFLFFSLIPTVSKWACATWYVSSVTPLSPTFQYKSLSSISRTQDRNSGDQTYLAHCTTLYSVRKNSLIQFKNKILLDCVIISVLFIRNFYATPIVISRDIQEIKKQGKKSQIFISFTAVVTLFDK
jgi:hypothetical protein